MMLLSFHASNLRAFVPSWRRIKSHKNILDYLSGVNIIFEEGKMIKPGCYMASVDVKDAYYTVPIQKDQQKFLKIELKVCLCKYTCLPNGLSSAPHIFTKMLKPVYSTLHNQGHISIGYIDDSYLQGDTRDECRCNMVSTATLFTELGFYIHPNKSVFMPTHTLTFLGFILDSVKMTISPTPEKVEKVVKACCQMVKKAKPLILDVPG